jgi:hypothetical protein
MMMVAVVVLVFEVQGEEAVVPICMLAVATGPR